MIAFEADIAGHDSAFDYLRVDVLAKKAEVEIAKIDSERKESCWGAGWANGSLTVGTLS